MGFIISQIVFAAKSKQFLVLVHMSLRIKCRIVHKTDVSMFTLDNHAIFVPGKIVGNPSSVIRHRSCVYFVHLW